MQFWQPFNPAWLHTILQGFHRSHPAREETQVLTSHLHLDSCRKESGGKDCTWQSLPPGWHSLGHGKRNSLQYLQIVMVFSVSQIKWTTQTRTLSVGYVHAIMLVSVCLLTSLTGQAMREEGIERSSSENVACLLLTPSNGTRTALLS